MGKAVVTFNTLEIKSQAVNEPDPNQNHLISTVHFSIEVDGRRYDNCEVDVKQPFGTDPETGPLEVAPPRGFRGAFNHRDFSDAAEAYYRGTIGPMGGMIRTRPGIKGFGVQNLGFGREQVVEIEFPDSQSGGW